LGGTSKKAKRRGSEVILLVMKVVLNRAITQKASWGKFRAVWEKGLAPWGGRPTGWQNRPDRGSGFRRIYPDEVKGGALDSVTAAPERRSREKNLSLISSGSRKGTERSQMVRGLMIRKSRR